MYETLTNEKPIYETRAMDVYASELRVQTKLTCPSHLHSHIEIFYLLSGRVAASVDFKQYEVCAGEALVVFPNQVHKFTSLEPGEASYLYIIHPNVTPEYAELFSSSRPKSPVIRGVDQDPTLHKLFLSLRESANDTDARYHALRTKGFLLSLYAAIFSTMDFEALSPLETDSAKSIVSFCSEHFSEDLSLDYLASRLRLSKFYISHIFNDKLEIGFNDYVNLLRYSEACRLLRETNLKIAEIAFLVGFNNVRTFNRVFVRFDTRSPSDYRKETLNKEENNEHR